jgi:DUF971 family protein
MSIARAERATPARIRRIAKSSVEIEWRDGHRSLYPNRYLRDNCPCAACREGKPRFALPVLSDVELYPLQIGVVGRYALSIEWSDRHDTGIYSYDTLRGLCPCDLCRPQGTHE